MPAFTPRAARALSRRALVIALLALGALLCFGMGQVLGHPLIPAPSAPGVVHTTLRHTGPAPGSLTAAPPAARTLALPLAAPPARHHSDHHHGDHGDHQGDGAGHGAGGEHSDGHDGNGGNGGGGD